MSTLQIQPGVKRRSAVPVCVDLDGTLIRTDLFYESLLAALKRHWWLVCLLPFWLLRGRAYLKRRLSSVAVLDASLLPYREDLFTWLESERVLGRTLVLATGSDRTLAEAVAQHLGIFEYVFASDGHENLTGKAKVRRLEDEFGPAGFDYVGDSRADTPVWAAARTSFAAGSAAGWNRACALSFPDSKGKGGSLLRAMRPKHWIKNLLVFVPLVAGHALLNLPLVGRAAIAFGAFSLTASAVYLVNDLLDLAADRRHPIKRKRPFASGDLPIVFGLAAAPVLFASGLGLASLLGRSSLAVLGVYLGLTFVYTFYLKRKLLVDVFALAALYTLRIIGGGAAPAFYVRSGCSPSPCFSF